MPVSRRCRGGMAGVVLAMFMMSSASQAHPHHWIDVFTEWQFDANGNIGDVNIRWLFDDYYSVLLLEDATATEAELQAILEKVLDNTAKHHYFIKAEQNGVSVEFGHAEQGRIGVRDHRIEIAFNLPLSPDLDPRRGDIVYRVAEPTYWFEMLHAEQGLAIVLSNAPPACGYQIEAPKPDAALVAYAASLGIDETGADDLGIQFAETVTIRCAGDGSGRT